MRLIDADALTANKFKNDISYNSFCNLVKRQPTIDAVQVVRCKDCKHMQEDKLFGDLRCRGRAVKPNWYCADGDRRDNG